MGLFYTSTPPDPHRGDTERRIDRQTQTERHTQTDRQTYPFLRRQSFLQADAEEDDIDDSKRQCKQRRRRKERTGDLSELIRLLREIRTNQRPDDKPHRERYTNQSLCKQRQQPIRGEIIKSR